MASVVSRENSRAKFYAVLLASLLTLLVSQDVFSEGFDCDRSPPGAAIPTRFQSFFTNFVNTTNTQPVREPDKMIQASGDWHNWPIDILSSRYSRNPRVEATFKELVDSSNPVSTKDCLLAVRSVGQAHGMIDGQYGIGARVPQAVVELQRQGFVNLMDLPQMRQQIVRPDGTIQLPAGAFTTYGNGPIQHRHIEMVGYTRTEAGELRVSGVSDFYAPNGLTHGKEKHGSWRLSGVWIRPTLLNY